MSVRRNSLAQRHDDELAVVSSHLFDMFDNDNSGVLDNGDIAFYLTSCFKVPESSQEHILRYGTLFLCHR